MMDGYAPIFAYLGEEGYLIDCELRPGDQHCQSGTQEFLGRAIKLARKATEKRLLVRMDSGNDAVGNLQILHNNKADYIIKRNLRRESLDDWLETAEAFGECEEPRPGKEVFVGQTHLDRDGKTYRVVFKVVRRTIDADGQRLLLPEIEVDTWWTSLKLPASDIIQPLSRARNQRTVSFGAEVGTRPGTPAERQVRDERPGAFARTGRLQHFCA